MNLRTLGWLWLSAWLLISPAPAQEWQREVWWNDEVWISNNGPWRAVVEKAYGRLRFLGLRDGANLLHSPTPPPDKLQIGGHRIWLGPQTEWAKMWPPPKNWEMLPARKIESGRNNRLTIYLPAGKATDVPLTRYYRWVRPGVLECRVEWQEVIPKGRQAIQIFQLNQPDGILARPNPSAFLPQGYIQMPLLKRKGIRTRFATPAQVQKKKGAVLLSRQSTEEKLAFPVQTLRAVWPTCELLLHPGQFQGVVKDETDLGCRSQVYLGSDEWPVIEIEQLSSRLAPGPVSHTVELELIRK